jgi:uncharacterized protein YPO0396
LPASCCRCAKKRFAELAGRISVLQKEQTALKERFSILSKLGEYDDFRDLDWTPVAVAIARLEAEKRDLEAASDPLKTLAAQLTAFEEERAVPRGAGLDCPIVRGRRALPD